MSFNITLPKITATNPSDQVKQLHSYLFRVTEQLNWAFNTLESSSGGNVSPAIKVEQGTELSEKDVENTFNSIKSLIIKSADIVKAYEETIFEDFNGKYFADSDFGTYLEETSRSVEENSKGVYEVYTNVQMIEGKVDGIEDDVRTTNAYIKRGLLGYDDSGNAVYGIAVGETDEKGVYKRYAWFTADKLTFFDENDSPVAYIGAGCLYIVGKSVFLGEIQLGGYKIDTSDGVAFTWIG
jgi:hypothetical protein